MLDQLGANLGHFAANLAPTWANLGQLGANLGQLGATFARLGPSLGQLGANLSQLEPKLGQLGANLGLIWPFLYSSSPILLSVIRHVSTFLKKCPLLVDCFFYLWSVSYTCLMFLPHVECFYLIACLIFYYLYFIFLNFPDRRHRP